MEGIKTKDGYRIPTKRFYIELNENLMLNEKYTPSYSGGTHIMGLTSRKLDYHYDLGWAYPVLPGRVSLTFAADSRTIRKFFTIEANETIYFEFNGNELIQKSQ